MKCRDISSVLLVLCFAVVLKAEDYYDEFDTRSLAEQIRELSERRSRAFECKRLSEGCRGILPCCGSLQCFWKDGYSLKTEGQCVECVISGQRCQRDAQCCSSLVCQKANTYHVDGYCDVKRSAGGECHEDDQCSSGNCLISNWNKLKGHGGICA